MRSKRTPRYPLENSVRHIEKGRRAGNKVKLSTHFELAPGEGPKVHRTLAYNPDTDERLVEVGNLSERASECSPNTKPELSKAGHRPPPSSALKARPNAIIPSRL